MVAVNASASGGVGRLVAVLVSMARWMRGWIALRSRQRFMFRAAAERPEVLD